MNSSPRKIDDKLLQQFVDNELSSAEEKRIRTRLKTDLDAQQRVREYQQINQMLGELHRDHPTLTSNTDTLIPLIKPQRRYMLAASIGWLAIGVLIGWLGNAGSGSIQSSQTPSPLLAQLARPAQLSYAVFSPEVLHPVEVSADQEQHLAKWLTKRLGESVDIPDLSKYGYQLLGGRLLAEGQGPAALFMYENSAGNRITLQLKQITDTTPTAFQFDENKGIRTFYWIDNGLGYALTGLAEKPDMLAMSQAIYHQLNL